MEISLWLLFKHVFNPYTFKVNLTPRVLYRLDWSVLDNLFKMYLEGKSNDLLKLIYMGVCLYFFFPL